MANIMPPRAQHIGALADITPKPNLPGVNSFGSDRKVRFVPATRLRSPSTRKLKSPQYKPSVEEDVYRKTFQLADALLKPSSIPVYVDTPNAPVSPNMSRRRDKSSSSLGSFTPTTPPLAQRGGEELVTIDETGVINIMKMGDLTAHAIVPPGANFLISQHSDNQSPLNKPLPPKPMLRAQDSPERPGLLDATEKDNTLSKHPTLQPTLSGEESPSSFRIASSLGSTPSSVAAEFGTGVVFDGQKSGSIHDLDFGDGNSVASFTPRTALKDGSPIHRVKRLSSMPSNTSLNRRQARSGVGLIIRKSADAHALIMGTLEPELPDESSVHHDSPHPPRTSSLPQVRSSSLPLPSKIVGQAAAARLSRPTAASIARATDSKKSLGHGRNLLGRAAASKISMASTTYSRKTSDVASKKNFRSVSNPLPESNTVSSIKKGFKSRISTIFSNRRRSIPPAVSSANKVIAGKVNEEEEEDIILEADFDHPPSTPTSTPTQPKIAHLEPSKVLNARSIPTINATNKKELPSTRETTNHEQSAKEQQRDIRDEISTSRTGGRLTPDAPTLREARRSRSGGDAPPSPPPSRDGATGHYAEASPVESLNPVANSNYMTEEQLDAYLEAQLRAAEEHLREVMNVDIDPTDPEARARVMALIRALGESVIAARAAHIAGIQLRAVTSNLIQLTTLRAANAREAITAAGQMTTSVAAPQMG